VIVQFANGDQTVPNPLTAALLRAGDLDDSATLFRNDLAFDANPALLKDPHGFLLQVSLPPFTAQANIALAAQQQIAVFMASDGDDVIDPDGPCLPDGSGCLFEVPIEGELPEDLGFIP
jgi:hypothetical protein